MIPSTMIHSNFEQPSEVAYIHQENQIQNRELDNQRRISYQKNSQSFFNQQQQFYPQFEAETIMQLDQLNNSQIQSGTETNSVENIPRDPSYSDYYLENNDSQMLNQEKQMHIKESYFPLDRLPNSQLSYRYNDPGTTGQQEQYQYYCNNNNIINNKNFLPSSNSVGAQNQNQKVYLEDAASGQQLIHNRSQNQQIKCITHPTNFLQNNAEQNIISHTNHFQGFSDTPINQQHLQSFPQSNHIETNLHMEQQQYQQPYEESKFQQQNDQLVSQHQSVIKKNNLVWQQSKSNQWIQSTQQMGSGQILEQQYSNFGQETLEMEQFENESNQRKNRKFKVKIQKSSKDQQNDEEVEVQIVPKLKRKYKTKKQIPDIPPARCGVLAINHSTPIILPNLTFQPIDNKKFNLFGDCILDLELLQEDSENYKQLVSQLFDDSKQVTHIQKVNNGDFLEITLNTRSKPLQEYSFLFDIIKSVSSQEAHQWFRILSLFQKKSSKQTEFIKNMMSQPSTKLNQLKDLFNTRQHSSFLKAQELIKQLPRNKYAKYCQYHFDYESQSVVLKHIGYSRKMLDLLGMNMQEAPSIFLRKGLLDMYQQKEKTYTLLLCAIQLVDHPKNDIIDQISGETFIHTLDLIKLQASMNVKLMNLTNAFDKQHNLNFPFCDDFLAEIIYEINPENLQKFQDTRQKKNIFSQFSTEDIISGELEELIDLKEFLQKYYSNSVYQINNKQEKIQKSQQQYKEMLEIKTGDAIVRSCVTQVTKANLITFMDPVYLDFIPNQ